MYLTEPPFSSSTEPTQSSVSKPPDSSERQRLYVLIAPVLFILVVLGVYFFCKGGQVLLKFVLTFDRIELSNVLLIFLQKS